MAKKSVLPQGWSPTSITGSRSSIRFMKCGVRSIGRGFRPYTGRSGTNAGRRIPPIRWMRAALARVPKGDEIRALIRRTGGAATCAEADIPAYLEDQGLRYGRYARFRMTMMRLLDIIEENPI